MHSTILLKSLYQGFGNLNSNGLVEPYFELKGLVDYLLKGLETFCYAVLRTKGFVRINYKTLVMHLLY